LLSFHEAPDAVSPPVRNTTRAVGM
jgi:hypothetical protein